MTFAIRGNFMAACPVKSPAVSLLLTDLYQLTMLQGYFDQKMEEEAVFEFFVRKLPACRNFCLAAGLEQILEFLENLRFTQKEIEWLAGQDRFTKTFLDYLVDFRFVGNVHAMPEGTIFFPDEPILRITAPLPQAQLVETRIINILHFQTMIASKAVRMVLAAPDRLLVDFGLRRAHGAEAGLLAARASYIAGFAGTSTVMAGAEFDIPIYGTMAHSFVQAHANEAEAFEHFAEAQPKNTVLLLDTYDTEAAAEKVVRLALKLKGKNIHIKAIRLDSGDLVEHARRVRRILDEGGLTDVRIFSSSSLDEYALFHCRESQAPIDGFGIGTKMDTSADAPYLDCAYKLQEYAGVARRKRSEGKATWPGRKQVYRHYDDKGVMTYDVLTIENDLQNGKPLIKAYMQEGKRLASLTPLSVSRNHVRAELTTLPNALKSLDKQGTYPVRISRALEELTVLVDGRKN